MADDRNNDDSCFNVDEKNVFLNHISKKYNGCLDGYVYRKLENFRAYKCYHKEGYTDAPFLMLMSDGNELETESYLDFMLKLYPRNSKQKTFAIDGTSCCGKSTLLNQFSSFKINDLLKHDIKTYNFDAACSFSYYFLSEYLANKLEYVAFDRSYLANIAYQYVYYIMFYIHQINGQLAETENGLFVFDLITGETPFAICENYTRIHHLTPLFEHINAVKPNIIFIIDSDVKSVAKRMEDRGKNLKNVGDLAKSACPQYILAQNAAFAYLAHKCNLPCIDLLILRKTTGNDSTYWSLLESYIKKYSGENFFKQRKPTPTPVASFSSNLDHYNDLSLLTRFISTR